MANKKISELDSGSPTTTSILPVSNAAGTATTKVTVQSIIDLVAANSSGFDPLKPAAPAGVNVAAGNQELSVSWTAPTATYKPPVTDYVIQYSSNSGSTWTTVSDGTSTTTSTTITGLTNGTSYLVRVAAVNAFGQGAWGSPASPASPSNIIQGGLYIVGGQYYGQGGFGNQNSYSEWTRSGSAVWKHASLGDQHAFYIKSDGTLWGAGANAEGRLGDGTTTDRLSLTQVAGTWIDCSCGDLYTVGIKANGTLWIWGSSPFNVNGSTPVQVGSDTDWMAVSAGTGHWLALKTSGAVYAAGYNSFGQCGDGTTTNRGSLVPVDSQLTFASISAGGNSSAAIRSNGDLYTWGGGGRNGHGSSSVLSPTKLGSDTWLSCTMYGSTEGGCALKSDGSVWGWGNVPRYGFDPTPSQRTAGPYVWLAGSGGHYLAIKSDGTLWILTQSGLGNYGNNTWSQIGTDTTWRKAWPSPNSASYAAALGAT